MYIDLHDVPHSNKDRFKEVDMKETRYYLAGLIHYISLCILVHKAKRNTGSYANELLAEALEESKANISKYYWTGCIYRGTIDKDRVIQFQLDEFLNEKYQYLIEEWLEFLMAAIRDYDKYQDESVLKCGFTVPLALLKIVRGKELVLFDSIPEAEVDLVQEINMYFDEVLIKLKLKERKKGSYIFS